MRKTGQEFYVNLTSFIRFFFLLQRLKSYPPSDGRQKKQVGMALLHIHSSQKEMHLFHPDNITHKGIISQPHMGINGHEAMVPHCNHTIIVCIFPQRRKSKQTGYLIGQENWQGGHVAGGRANAPAFLFTMISRPWIFGSNMEPMLVCRWKIYPPPFPWSKLLFLFYPPFARKQGEFTLHKIHGNPLSKTPPFLIQGPCPLAKSTLISPWARGGLIT